MSGSSPTTVRTSRPVDEPADRQGWRWRWAIPVLVAVVALAVRLSAVLRGGGLYGYFGYDDGVYFAAAASLLAGRLPYQDFILLHPPGIVLALVPFAELGRLTTDRDAMAVARVVWLLVGALNAGLVARLAGVLGPPAALVSGLFAATWYHSAYGERVPLLEPLGNLALITALLLVVPRPRRLPERYAEVLAGVALGLGTCVKIWGVVPLGVVAVALLVTRGWRAAGRLAAGAAAVGLLVFGPFLVAAPKAMIRMLVLAQGGRESNGYAIWEKPTFFLGVPQYLGRDNIAAIVVVTVLAGAVLAAATVLALRIPLARLWVALLAVHTLMLLVSPVFFAHYAEFLTVPLALVLGAGAAGWFGTQAARAPRGLGRAVPVGIGVILLSMGVGTATQSFGVRYPGDKLAAFVPAQGCVRADDPGALIQLNVLTRDLGRGCEIPVDFTGVTYYRPVHRADGSTVPRGKNAQWQRRARSYLTSGAATVLVRRTGNAFNKTTREQLAALPVLGRVGPWKILGPPR
ncbi:MAG TPA: glycosyltransferase 87 family protein [Actinomycetales bacterium]|nr:glycosyltransferase 87 family protein [Actinomycetales bacterium]